MVGPAELFTLLNSNEGIVEPKRQLRLRIQVVGYGEERAVRYPEIRLMCDLEGDLGFWGTGTLTNGFATARSAVIMEQCKSPSSGEPQKPSVETIEMPMARRSVGSPLFFT